MGLIPNFLIGPFPRLRHFAHGRSIEYLKQGGLFDGWVADCPLVFTSPNAPRKRDVLGTLLLLEMFQPPLSIGSRLAPRATTLPHSSVCRSMFMPIFCSTSVATCASA